METGRGCRALITRLPIKRGPPALLAPSPVVLPESTPKIPPPPSHSSSLEIAPKNSVPVVPGEQVVEVLVTPCPWGERGELGNFGVFSCISWASF